MLSKNNGQIGWYNGTLAHRALVDSVFVPAVSHGTLVIGMKRNWGLTSPNSYHRAELMVLQPFNTFVCAFQGTERWTSKSSLLQVLISIQGKCSCRVCGTGKCGGRRQCRFGGSTQLGSAMPVELVLPFALTLLDKAVSLSLQFSS